MVRVRGRLRPGGAARACVVTGEVMGLSTLAHASAGGELPPLVWFASMSAVVMAVSVAVLRGSIRIRTAVPVIAVLQVGLHLAFQMTAMQGPAGHAMALDHRLHLSMPMLLAHLITAVAAGLLLVVQERAVARARAWFNAWSRPSSLVPIPPRSAVSVAGVYLPRARRMLLLRSPRRGPPTVSPVAP